MNHFQRIAKSIALAVALAAANPVAADGVQLAAVPRAPAWTLGHSFVTALNGYDRPALEHFLAGHLTPTALRQQAALERARDLLRLRRQMGLVEIVEVSGVPHALVFDVRSADHQNGAEIVILMETRESDRAEEIVLIPNRL